MTDATGEIIYVNENFERISGYTSEKVIGRDHRFLKSDHHDSDFFRELWETISRGEVWRAEVCNLHKDGSEFWVDTTITPYLDQDAQPYQYVAIYTDITRLKRTELEERTAKERLRRGQLHGNIGTWEREIATNELYWSERVGPLFGLGEGAQIGSFQALIDAIHPEDRKLVIDGGKACIDFDIPYNVEHRAMWPDGTVRWLLVRGAVTRDKDGKPLQMLGVVQDIDDRKRAEIAAIEARQKAQNASREKSAFLARMSHEVRTPLNAILGFSQLLETDEEPALSDDQLAAVLQISRSGEHLLQLVNQLLDLSGIESGNLSLSIEPIDAAPLLEECLAVIEGQPNPRNIRVIKPNLEAGRHPRISADRTRLKQIVINLLSNALKYNTTGEIIESRIMVAGENLLRLEISDDGPGIPKEKIQNLFVAFDRLGAESTSIQGTGIGLTISRELARLMDSDLTFEHRREGGSVFSVELPFADTSTG